MGLTCYRPLSCRHSPSTVDHRSSTSSGPRSLLWGGEEVSAVMKRHHKRRRLAALAACVATIATLATLGSAGSAAASVTCRAPGFGSGDSTQTIAMAEVWLTSSGWFSHSNCSSTPEFGSITYDHTSAGQALEEFGNNTGELNAHEDSVAFESTGTKE